MARSFSQRPGVEIFETFSPGVGSDIVRTVLALSSMKEWKLGALEFKLAYLNAALSEDIWLELPDGSNVTALNALYGQRQSASGWKKELRDALR